MDKSKIFPVRKRKSKKKSRVTIFPKSFPTQNWDNGEKISNSTTLITILVLSVGKWISIPKKAFYFSNKALEWYSISCKILTHEKVCNWTGEIVSLLLVSVSTLSITQCREQFLKQCLESAKLSCHLWLVSFDRHKQKLCFPPRSWQNLPSWFWLRGKYWKCWNIELSVILNWILQDWYSHLVLSIKS